MNTGEDAGGGQVCDRLMLHHHHHGGRGLRIESNGGKEKTGLVNDANSI